MINFALAVVILLCLWAVTSSRVHTGMITTSGLVLVIVGCLAAFDDVSLLYRAFSIIVYGLVLIGGGFLLSHIRQRRRAPQHDRRRAWPTI